MGWRTDVGVIWLRIVSDGAFYEHGNGFSACNERRRMWWVGQQPISMSTRTFFHGVTKVYLSPSCRATFVMFWQLYLLRDSLFSSPRDACVFLLLTQWTIEMPHYKHDCAYQCLADSNCSAGRETQCFLRKLKIHRILEVVAVACDI
jgi:hypothetical protein